MHQHPHQQSSGMRRHRHTPAPRLLLACLAALCLSLLLAHSTWSPPSTSPSSRSSGAASSSLLLHVAAQNTTLQFVLSAGVRGRMMPVSNTSQSDCSLDPLRNRNGTCNGANGGVSRRAAFIAKIKAQYPNQTVALDPGNNWFGSLFAQFDRGATIARWLGISGYDVLGLGTVDFFGGPSLYGDFLRALPPEIPVVCSNIDVSAEPTLPAGRILPYTMLQIGNASIGVVGCVEHSLAESSSSGPRVVVDRNFTCVNFLASSIARMKRDYPMVDKIVAMATPSFANRGLVYDIATTVQDVDIVVTEYSPTLSVAGYESVTNIFGSRVIILAIPYVVVPLEILGSSMVHASITFDSTGQVVDGSGYVEVLDQTKPDDPRLWARPSPQVPLGGPVQQAAAQVLKLNGAVVGKLTVDFTGAGQGQASNASSACVNNACNVGLLVAQSMLDWCTDCDVAHINAGGLRSDITMTSVVSPPNITRLDVLQTLYYGNTIVSYNIRAPDFLKQVIQESISARSSLRYQQWAGVRIATNQDLNVVVYLEIYDRRTGKWRPYDPDAIYRVTTILYLYNGGDRYSIAPYASNANLFGPNDAETLISSMQKYPSRVYPSSEQLQSCYSQNYDTVDSWIAPDYCTVATSSLIANLARVCPTRNDSSFCTPGGLAYDGKYFNSSLGSCTACSGLGTCQEGGTFTCTCDGPSTEGLFAGVQMIQGTDCGQIRTEYLIPDALYYVCLTLSGITIALSILVSAFFYYYRAARVVKRSSTTFLQLCCLGALCGGVCGIFATFPVTSANCVITDWLGHVGFCILFGSLFIKTQRIWQLFSNKKMQLIQLTDWDMIKRLGILIALEVTLRLTETMVSPMERTAVELGGSGGCAAQTNKGAIQSDWQYWFQCRSSKYSLFDGLKWGTKVALTIWGVILAVLVRDIDKNYNESKMIGMTIYNMAIFAGLSKAAVYFLDKSSPVSNLALTVITLNYVVICTLIGLSLPKYLHIRASGDEEDGTKHKHSPGGVKSTAAVSMAAGGERGKGGANGSMVGVNASQAGTSPSAAMMLLPQHFQQACNNHVSKLNHLEEGERRSQLASYISYAQAFLTRLEKLKDSATAAASSSVPSSSRSDARSPKSGSIIPFPRASTAALLHARTGSGGGSNGSLSIRRPTGVNGSNLSSLGSGKSSLGLAGSGKITPRSGPTVEQPAATTTPRDVTNLGSTPQVGVMPIEEGSEDAAASTRPSVASRSPTIAGSVEMQPRSPSVIESTVRAPLHPGTDSSSTTPRAPISTAFVQLQLNDPNPPLHQPPFDAEEEAPVNEVYEFDSD